MLSQLRQNPNQSILTFLVALVCIVAVGVLQVPQLNYLRHRGTTASAEAFQKEVNSERLRLNLLQKIPAFGFDNVLADWMFLNFLEYFGDDEARAVTGYSLSPDYFEIIVDHDPRFLGAYTGLSTSISLYAARPETSIALMDKGLKFMSSKIPPKSYYVWRQKGIDELLFLGNAQAARHSFENAAKWASVYSNPESRTVAELSRKTAEFLTRNPKSKSAQVAAWVMVLNNAIDDRTRKIAIDRIEALGGKVNITPEGKLMIQAPRAD